MRVRLAALVLAGGLLAGCANQVTFLNTAPDAPFEITGTLYRPRGAGRLPAVVLAHGCHGVLPHSHRWARWLTARGYAALIVDSFGPRASPAECNPPSAEDFPPTVRFDDLMGALRYLQAQPFVAPGRIAAMGWSQGGVFAMAVVNGPSLERARRRGVALPEVGFAAAVALYPGGCRSLLHELVERPLLVLTGGADDWILAGPCEDMVARMRARGADAAIVVYPGAYHYFDVEDQPLEVLPEVGNPNRPGGCCGATVGYDPAAARDAAARVERFLARHLKGGGR
jgi:dienelactone hydrolase